MSKQSSSLVRVRSIMSNGSYKPFTSLNQSVALIFCNSYHQTSLDLGECALNDGLLAYDRYINFGYTPFLYHDVTKREFKLILQTFLEANIERLSIYFIGHGSQVNDTNHDETDGCDEAFILKDGYVIDDTVHALIMKHRKSMKLTLISDCCHSGSIFDIDSKSDILTISACRDSECAAQYWFERKGNGCFSYYFWKFINETNNCRNLKAKIDVKLKPFHQCCTMNHMSESIL